MINRLFRSVILLSVTLIIDLWSLAYAQYFKTDMAGQDIIQAVVTESSVAANLISIQALPGDYCHPVLRIMDNVESNLSEGLPYRFYVTPKDQAIESLAARINGARGAYEIAVQWIYVSEQKLNYTTDKWLTPHEFLAKTPHYPSNPLKGKEVSDCEEQAHSLVSLIRAEGIRPEEVRVVIGEVEFAGRAIGHVWVELLINGCWVALDPVSGPYWDDDTERLIIRQGHPFNYYTSHDYPVLQVHAYYNDIYYLDLKDGSGNAPVLWRLD